MTSDNSGYSYLLKLNGRDSTGKDITNWVCRYTNYLGNFMPKDPESKQQDWWGFYNGAVNNKTLLALDSNLFLMANAHKQLTTLDIPVRRKEGLLYYGFVSEGSINGYQVPSFDRSIPFADRQYRFDYARFGTLEALYTPNGGVVNYTYEPHRYQQTFQNGTVSSKIMDGGGIRIKTISIQDSDGSVITRKDYKYGWGDPERNLKSEVESGYGYLIVPGNVLSVNNNYIGSVGQIEYSTQNLMLLSHPVNNLDMYNGSYVAYGAVTEYLNGNADGHTTYCYNPGATNLNWNIITSPPAADNLILPAFWINNGIRNNSMTDRPLRIYTYLGEPGNMDYYYLVKKQINHFTDVSNPNEGLKSYYGGIIAQLAGVKNATSSYCYFPPGANTDLQCTEMFSIPGMDDNGASNYIGDSYNNPYNVYFTGKYGIHLLGSNEIGRGSFCHLLDTTTVVSYNPTTHYDDNGFTSKTFYRYENPAHLLPTWIGTLNGQGDTLIQHITYPQDYGVTGGSSPITSIRSEPVEVIRTIRKPGDTEKVIGADLTTYKQTPPGKQGVDKIYSLNINNNLLPFSSFTRFNGSTLKDSHYELH
jgi:hypothetical protein